MTPFRERNKTVIGAAGILALLILLIAAFKTDSLPIIGGGSTYNAEFSEGAGLQKMDEVRVAGVKVGKVTGISFKTNCSYPDGTKAGCVLVKMLVKNVHLGALTRADIKIKTVLGRKFVMLEPAGDSSLSQTIPLSRTQAPYDVSPAFQQLATTVGSIDTTLLAKSFTTLADDFRGSPAEVKASLDGLSRLSQTIASRDAKLRTLLNRAAGVTQVLANRNDDLVAFLKDSDLLLQEVKARRAAIHTLLTTTTQLSEQLIGLVRENRAALAPALADLKVVTDMLKANENNLDLSLQRLAPFVRLFANNLGNGRWFDTYVYNLTDPSGFVPGTFGNGS
ncbi:MAG: phospholipid/cholesterol/gamma-HCH transport system substrate-binding protein [Frankiales bacterium]|nr:phospholipid/cholesterol/gamma-HCH transport system substrate-binding protein [Frankiales bacterium]